MPLRFEDPKEGGDGDAPVKAAKPKSAMKKREPTPVAEAVVEEEIKSPKGIRGIFGKKKKEEDPDDKPKKKSSNHRRVFTQSSQYFANLIIKVIKANDLPGKKSMSPFVQLYLGSESFSTKTKRKTLNPEFNEEFECQIDRDENVSIKIWDMGKFERTVDNPKKIEPICKKKMTMKEFARKGCLDHALVTYQMVGGGTLDLEITFEMIVPVPGEIHTKTFSYPSWMSDKYNVNQVPPDENSLNTGWSTMARYVSRWMLNQRAIQATLANAEEEEEDDGEEGCLPEGLKYELLDISCSHHDKAQQIIVTYTWTKEEEKDEEEDLFVRPKILTHKLFTVSTKISKKKQYEGKNMSSKAYQECFDHVRESMEEVMQKALHFTRTEPMNGVYKLNPISTPQSHHILLWYYK